MASLHTKHTRACALGPAWTKPDKLDGCTCEPVYYVVVRHGRKTEKVRAGQNVHQGDVIGYEGNTGHSTGAHLHWMVEFNGNFVNPRMFT